MSDTKQDGGPAFPHSLDWGWSDKLKRYEATGFHGMSLRFWLAGQALAGVMTGAKNLSEATKEQRANLFAVMAAVLCEAADAVLKAREK